MPRQLHSTKTSRGHRQATSTRPYTRSTQHDTPVTADNNSPGRRRAR